jgi:hypothetical protein
MKLFERAVKFLCPTFYGGGGEPSNSTSTVYQRNIPTELAPYYELLLNASTKQAFTSASNPSAHPPAKLVMDPHLPSFDQTLGMKAGQSAYNPTTGQAQAQQYTKSYKDGGAIKGYSAGDVTTTTTGTDTVSGTTGVDALKAVAGTQLEAITGMQDYKMAFSDDNNVPDYTKYAAGFNPLQVQAQNQATNLAVPDMLQPKLDAENAGIGYSNSAIEGLSAVDDGIDLSDKALAAGNAGQKAGLTGQDLGTIGGKFFGETGAAAGNAGQDLGTLGGKFYGGLGADYGANAAALGTQSGTLGVDAGSRVNATATDLANRAAASGQQYENKATSADAVQAYMNPYLQQSLQPQLDLLQQQNDITKQKNNSAAAQQSAYGGSRQAVQNALTDQGNALASANIIGQGYNTAYDKAQQNILAGSQLGQQGIGMANQSLGTALQGTSTGLAGLNQAMSGQQAGMQGAQIGLSGVNTALSGTAQGMQGAGLGLQGVNTALSGTAQGIQGANTSLAGVGAATNAGQYGLQGLAAAQAGYAGMNSSAANLAALKAQDLTNQENVINAKSQVGQQIQARDQQIIDNTIAGNDFIQNRPMQVQGQYANMLNGVNTSASTSFTPKPSLLAQAGGTAITLAGLAGSLKAKKGGAIKLAAGGQVGGIGDLAVYNALNGVA